MIASHEVPEFLVPKTWHAPNSGICISSYSELAHPILEGAAFQAEFRGGS